MGCDRMSDRELQEKIFDFLEDKTKWLYEKDLIKNWFNILSWTALTSVIFVIAKNSGSFILKIIGVISFILVFFYGWHSLFYTVNVYADEKKNGSILFLILIAVCAMAAPAFLIYYMMQAITFLVQKHA